MDAPAKTPDLLSSAGRQGGVGGPSRARRAAKIVRSMPFLIRVSILLFVGVAILGVLAPLISPATPTAQDLLNRLQAPTLFNGELGNTLGTDQLGRDVLTRTLYGIRTSLAVASIGMVFSLLIGVTLGLLSGLAGGTLDNIVMFLVDTQLALPFILIALVAIAVFGTSLTVLIVVISVARWETYARVTRGQVLLVREQPFAEAAKGLGASFVRVALKHVLPNVASPLIVLATANLSSLILLESTLSFLGVGVQPPVVSLGSLVSTGRDYLITAWWLSVIPSIVLVTLTMTISLIGDWLRDTLDPRVRQ